MGTIANAKVTHYYNCYNGDFIGCLRYKVSINSKIVQLVIRLYPAAYPVLRKIKHLIKKMAPI